LDEYFKSEAPMSDVSVTLPTTSDTVPYWTGASGTLAASGYTTTGSGAVVLASGGTLTSATIEALNLNLGNIVNASTVTTSLVSSGSTYVGSSLSYNGITGPAGSSLAIQPGGSPYPGRLLQDGTIYVQWGDGPDIRFFAPVYYTGGTYEVGNWPGGPNSAAPITQGASIYGTTTSNLSSFLINSNIFDYSTNTENGLRIDLQINAGTNSVG
jgi:hypothetical protein